MSGFELLIIVIAFLLVAGTAVQQSLCYKINVKGQVEWAIIEDIDGHLTALPPGAHSLAPGTKETDRVPINIQERQETGEEVKTSDGIRLALDERLNFVAGHKMFDQGGGWFDFAPLGCDGKPVIDPNMVILASVSINPGEKTDVKGIYEQIKLAVDAAAEVVFGRYKVNQLLNVCSVALAERPHVPNVDIPGLPWGPTAGNNVVDNTRDLYIRLSAMIRAEANRSLATIGIGLRDLSITNLRYFDPELQKTSEAGRKKKMLAEQLEATLSALPDRRDLTAREALVLGDVEFGQVAVSQLNLNAAQATARATVDAAKATAAGYIKAAEALAGGAGAIAEAAKNVQVKLKKTT